MTLSKDIEKNKKLGYMISGLISVLNILLLINDISIIWGINLPYYFKHPQITRKFLMKYEYYVRLLVTSAFMLLITDTYVYKYYKQKHGINPPRTYGIALCSYLLFVFLVAYYLYQLISFIYFAFLSVFGLTYYLTLQNPYIEELQRSNFIKKKE